MARVRRKRPLEDLETLIGLRFADRDRLERAVTHSSLGKSGGRSYERLEFLGDRVLGLSIAERLIELYPQSDEGDLSVRLNALVSAETCAEVAGEIGLEPFIRHGGDLRRADGGPPRNVVADVMEALIAAVHLEHGIEASRAFVLRHWGQRLKRASFARRDPKTELQEWSHRQSGAPPRYELLARTGPDHEPLFRVRASAAGVAPAEGEGRSKRAAEQEAATAILTREGVWSAEG